MSKAPDSTKPPKLVVIGNGMAARRVLEKFFELSPHHHQVTVFGAEPRVYYSRVILSPVLSDEKSSSRRHHSRRRLVLAQRRNVAPRRDDCRDRSRRQNRDECWGSRRTLRQADHRQWLDAIRHAGACRESSEHRHFSRPRRCRRLCKPEIARAARNETIDAGYATAPIASDRRHAQRRRAMSACTRSGSETTSYHQTSVNQGEQT